MKRSFEGFQRLYVVLHKSSSSEFVDQNVLIEKKIREGVIATITGAKVELVKAHGKLIETL